MLTGVRDVNGVVRAVLEAAALQHLWTQTGPTAEALGIRDGRLLVADDTRTWVLLAFALFNGTGGLTVTHLFETLNESQLPIALSLMLRVAMGPRGLESILDGGGEDPEGGASLN